MTAIGAYVGTTPLDLAAYEKWLGRPLDNVLVSINQTGWDAFDSSIGYDVAQWEGATTSTPIWSVPLTVAGTPLAETATGADDIHYYKAAQAIATNQAGSGAIYIRVGWEFNIAGQPWAAQGQEAAFIQSYQDLVDTFRSVSSRFKFVWDVNIGGTYNPALAYPGDKYVDVIGADMYYNPQWDGTDPKAAFATKVSEQYGLNWQQDFAAAHGKPTAMSEWGVDTDASGPYIQAAQQWFASHNMIYENYWESNAAYAGELHEGAYPDAGKAFQQSFGISSPTTATVSTATGFVSTAGLSGTGAVVVDLAGGFVTKDGAVQIDLLNVQSVQLGSDPTTIYGLKLGTDNVLGGTGAFSFYGQGAADAVVGGSGTATIMGGTGAESFSSGGGTNVMYGGTAANTMVGGTASTSQDTFYGKGGTDTVTGQGGTVTLFGGGGGTEKLNGGGGTNTLYGGSGTNILTGLMQADSQGRTGTNILYGGTGTSAGTDIVYAGVGVNLIYEGSGTDYIASNAGSVSVYGGSGQSFVYGGTGAESIFTGPGNQNVQTGYAITSFYDTGTNLTAGRFDKIDGFSSAKDTELYLPKAVQGATSFAPQNGGTAILTGVGPGSAEIFVSDASVAAVFGHTHFTL